MDNVEMYVATNGEYGWRLVAGNGRIILAPDETFSTSQNAVRNLVRVAESFGIGVRLGACDGIKTETVLRALRARALNVLE